MHVPARSQEHHPVDAVTTEDVVAAVAAIDEDVAFDALEGRIREQLLTLSDTEHRSTYCIVEATVPLQRYGTEAEVSAVLPLLRAAAARRR